jgi:hypothetical protein
MGRGKIPLTTRYRAFYLRRGTWGRRILPNWRVFVKPPIHPPSTIWTSEIQALIDRVTRDEAPENKSIFRDEK